MPLRVPEGDVAMRLAGEVARWTVGEALVFDDAFVRRPSGTRVAAPLRRGSSAKTSRGVVAGVATWTFRGDESRRRRGRDVDLPRRRDAAAAAT